MANQNNKPKQKDEKPDAFESRGQVKAARHFLQHLVESDTTDDFLGIVSENKLYIITGHLNIEKTKDLLRRNFYALLVALNEPDIEIFLDIGGDIERLSKDMLHRLSGIE